MKILRLISLLFISGCIQAQNFSEKTSAVKLNFNAPSVSTTLPRIDWTNPALERSNSSEEKVIVAVNVTSDVSLKEVRVELSHGADVLVKKYPIDDQASFRKKIEQSVRLLPGENSIKVVAQNTEGGIVSSTRSIVSGKDALTDAVDVNRRDYALIIATDKYDNWDDLVNPINDAKTIEFILKDKYGFQTELIENPTLEEISNKLYDYNTKKFNPQDQLLIFVAGHGSFDETLGEGYLVASNSLRNDVGKSSYLSHTVLRSRIDNIKSEHIFLMMDVCFGGTFDPPLAKTRSAEESDEEIDKKYLVKKLTKHTRKFLTSGGKQYVPDGAPGKHSPFAEKFILALREKGRSSGRILSLVELQPYFLRLSTEPRFGSFGKDDPASDFVFVAIH